MTLWMPLLAACVDHTVYRVEPAPAPVDVDQPEVAPDTALACPSALLDPGVGGTVDIGDAQIQVDPGTFVDQVTVTLCPAAVPPGFEALSSGWSVAVEPDLTPRFPLQLAIRTAESNPAAALFVPGPDGSAVRSLVAEQDPDEGYTSRIWRAGTSFVAADDRRVEPFDPQDLALDLSVVMDDTCSMLDEQTKLGNLLPDMLARLDTNAVDYHVGVITTSSGYLMSAHGATWVEPDTKRGADLLAELLAVGNGSNLDHGVASLASAFGPNGADTTYGPGFLRADALLQVLVVSGEDDDSQVTAAEAADALWSLQRPSLAVHELVPLQAAPKYLELNALVGGYVQDLDGDWDALLCDVGDDLLIDSAMKTDPLSTPELWVVPLDGEPALCDAPYHDPQTGALSCLGDVPKGAELWVISSP